MMMRRILFVLAVCTLLGAPTLMAAPSLGWDRGDAGTTYQEWTFDDGENPAAPEIDENPYGPAEATISDNGAIWFSSYIGRSGVWGNHPELQISLDIPNQEVPNPWKEIWLEIGYRGILEQVTVEPLPGGATVEPIPIAQNTWGGADTNFWYKSVYAWHIEPNPDAEVIFISATGTGGFIDYVAVDTICIPAPGAVLLGSIGAGLVGWLRRRRSL